MSREEIEKLSERLLSFANHIDRKRCAEATETDADNAREAAQAITALLAENERLREALAPFAEASRLAKIGGYPPYQFIKAGDYGNAEAALTPSQGVKS